jgi:hypothetical protein
VLGSDFSDSGVIKTHEELPLSHLSVELGQLYQPYIDSGLPALRKRLAAIAPWVDAPRLASIARVPEKDLRCSTILLIDDYFEQMPPPSELLPVIIGAAADAGIRIDYVGRESAIAWAGSTGLAAFVEGMVLSDPPFGENGTRPALSETGWLCNGGRSPSNSTVQAMGIPPRWHAPSENGARQHSIFLDVQLWSQRAKYRIWSISFLAAIWQLLRLGLLCVPGVAPINPVPCNLDGLPDRWSELPTVAAFGKDIGSFSAYRSFTVIPADLLSVEHAVRVILGQVAVSPTLLEQMTELAVKDGVVLPRDPVNRISYLMLSE